LYAEVLRLHEVTPEEFRKSYRYYLDHPELNQLLFDSVIARGVRARTEMYDRPSSGYHAPMPPANVKPGIVRPGPMKPVNPGVIRPGVIRPGVGPGTIMPGRPVVPGRMDSIMRAMRVKRDTTKGRP
jgi:hypothetical protein